MIFGAMIAAGIIWQIAYSAGYRTGTQDTSDATLAAAASTVILSIRRNMTQTIITAQLWTPATT